MPRTSRKKSDSGIYHIILRGINRQTIFEDEEDAAKFLYKLKDYKETCGYKIYAYCLMNNHIHLLFKEEKEDLGLTMRRIGASYVYWYNLKYGRCGHLFQDRYKSEAVEDERYLFTVLRYIHQNPVKAGITANAAAYKWSSYSQFLMGESEIVDTDFILCLFGSERKKAIDSFKVFHEKFDSEDCLDIDDKSKRNDNEAKEIIKRICNVPNTTQVQVLEKDTRNQYMRTLKEEGLSTRQIARLTGISRKVILKA